MKLKKKFAVLTLAVALLVSLGAFVPGGENASATSSGAFRDVPSDSWCAKAVNTMAKGNLIKGYSNGTFRPNGTMSAGAFITVIARCAGTDYGADGNGWWCGSTVREARNSGWLPKSYQTAALTSSVYRQPITREAAMCVLMRGLWPQSKNLGYTSASIPDYASISSDLQSDVLQAYNAGITTGTNTGTFGPKKHLTRGQAATILYRSGYTKAADTSITKNTSGCEIHYIDVGQADSILIRCDGHNMLIDGGNVADSSLIYSYLKKYDINYLDYMVNTHPHEDHVGGLPGALNAATVGTVYAPTTTYHSKPFKNFVKYVQNQGKQITIPETGSTFTLGNASFQVIGPQKTTYSDVNDTSIVLRMTYGSTSFLFTGDAQEASEYDMLQSGLPLTSTVLKVGHHGSSSSSSYAFLRAVSPKYAVISCGIHNDYGHPTKTVLSRLRDAGAKVYRTDMQGTIIATSDGKNVTFKTAKNSNAQTNPTLTDGSGQNSQEVAYIGNIHSKKFHRPTCPSLPAKKNQILFPSREAAIAEGYTPCSICKP